MRAELNLQKIDIKFLLLCLLIVYACRTHHKKIHIKFILQFLLVVYACRAHLTKNSHKNLYYCVYWLFMLSELTLLKIHVRFILLYLLVVYACRAHLTNNSNKVYNTVFIGCLCVQSSPYKKFT
jgi:hypothetical protein